MKTTLFKVGDKIYNISTKVCVIMIRQDMDGNIRCKHEDQTEVWYKPEYLRLLHKDVGYYVPIIGDCQYDYVIKIDGVEIESFDDQFRVTITTNDVNHKFRLPICAEKSEKWVREQK